MNNLIIEKAQELGKLIKDSEVRKAAVLASDKMKNDSEAVKLLASYNETREKEMIKLREKEPSKEELEAFRDSLQKEFDKLMENEIIKDYIEKNKELDMLVEQVNAILAYYISGEEEQGHGSCSGSCSSCGGCH